MYMYIIIHMHLYIIIITIIIITIITIIIIIIRSTQLVVAKVEFSYLELVQKNTKQDAAMTYLSVR